jgi:hypothetical protein
VRGPGSTSTTRHSSLFLPPAWAIQVALGIRSFETGAVKCAVYRRDLFSTFMTSAESGPEVGAYLDEKLAWAVAFDSAAVGGVTPREGAHLVQVAHKTVTPLPLSYGVGATPDGVAPLRH